MNSIDVLAIGVAGIVTGIMTFFLVSCTSIVLKAFATDNNDLSLSGEESEKSETFENYQKYCFEN